ncbi:GNAT family N-acetyltransferase [Halobacteria archaeon AArc-m2/3/4]|uniref:GNAT family N-acetyltransferase n=1 Tax=Natronoglomus mannanivorans TaxID=2979990 RepID=A0ABT2QI49_9EURY|nr:GNAT family N-acetyltransferase [Halobacteria archaeon AArc-m2/3/4]
MEYEIQILGWPPDGPTLRLDYREFSYAGKFVMSNTGKAVARTAETIAETEAAERADGEFETDVVAAVAFNEDRTDPDTLWLRYVTVRADLRGNGIGPQLVRHVRDRAVERGYERLRIAVNNPYAYEALSRVGFAYTGETTGIAELLLEYSSSVEPNDDTGDDPHTPEERYRHGLETFLEADRDLTDGEVAFCEAKLDRGPPDALDSEAEKP